jgi:hypothetical protein
MRKAQSWGLYSHTPPATEGGGGGKNNQGEARRGATDPRSSWNTWDGCPAAELSRDFGRTLLLSLVFLASFFRPLVCVHVCVPHRAPSVAGAHTFSVFRPVSLLTPCFYLPFPKSRPPSISPSSSLDLNLLAKQNTSCGRAATQPTPNRLLKSMPLLENQ